MDWNKKVIDSIYAPQKQSNTGVSTLVLDLFASGEIREFAYGTQALIQVIQDLKIPRRSKIALPAFICRDLLSAFTFTGIVPVFYGVDQNLKPLELDQLPDVKAIILVNYFGFAQELSPFRNFSKHRNIPLIEDNAHGFLSKSPTGELLGTRCKYGIMSPRKTFRTPNGGLFFKSGVNRNWIKWKGEYQSLSIIRKVKKSVRGIIGGIFGRHLIKLIYIYRFFFHIKDEVKEAYSAASIGQEVPFNLEFNISSFNHQAEVSRRQELYLQIEELVRDWPLQKVFPELPKGCVPFGFPFITDREKLKEIQGNLHSLGLECVPWPKLPEEIEVKVGKEYPEFYDKLWFVRFLW